jgi:hypothetical protein
MRFREDEGTLKTWEDGDNEMKKRLMRTKVGWMRLREDEGALKA